jgi:uncharacterized protein (DUF433 family)
MSPAPPYKYLAPNPKSSYKQLFVKGTRIRARVLYGCHRCEEDPRTPEQIAEDYNLSVKAVKEAITYCASDPPELLEDYRREDAWMEASGMHDPNDKYHPSPQLLTAHEMARINRSS